MDNVERFSLREAARELGVPVSTLRWRIQRQNLVLERVPGKFGPRYTLTREHLARLREADPGGTGPLPDLAVGLLEAAPEPPAEALLSGWEAKGADPGGTPPQVSRPAPCRAQEGPSEALPAPALADGTAPTEGVQAVPPGSEVTPADPGGTGPPPPEERVPLAAHLAMVGLLERSQESLDLTQRLLLEQASERARLERQVEHLQFELLQHRRALTEQAESLAEARALTLEAELKLATPQSRPGWSQRLRRWLGLERGSRGG